MTGNISVGKAVTALNLFNKQAELASSAITKSISTVANAGNNVIQHIRVNTTKEQKVNVENNINIDIANKLESVQKVVTSTLQETNKVVDRSFKLVLGSIKNTFKGFTTTFKNTFKGITTKFETNLKQTFNGLKITIKNLKFVFKGFNNSIKNTFKGITTNITNNLKVAFNGLKIHIEGFKVSVGDFSITVRNFVTGLSFISADFKAVFEGFRISVNLLIASFNQLHVDLKSINDFSVKFRNSITLMYNAIMRFYTVLKMLFNQFVLVVNRLESTFQLLIVNLQNVFVKFHQSVNILQLIFKQFISNLVLALKNVFNSFFVNLTSIKLPINIIINNFKLIDNSTVIGGTLIIVTNILAVFKKYKLIKNVVKILTSIYVAIRRFKFLKFVIQLWQKFEVTIVKVVMNIMKRFTKFFVNILNSFSLFFAELTVIINTFFSSIKVRINELNIVFNDFRNTLISISASLINFRNSFTEFTTNISLNLSAVFSQIQASLNVRNVSNTNNEAESNLWSFVEVLSNNITSLINNSVDRTSGSFNHVMDKIFGKSDTKHHNEGVKKRKNSNALFGQPVVGGNTGHVGFPHESQPIHVNTLVGELNINVTNLKESTSEMKNMIVKTLLKAVQDAQLTANINR